MDFLSQTPIPATKPHPPGTTPRVSHNFPETGKICWSTQFISIPCRFYSNQMQNTRAWVWQQNAESIYKRILPFIWSVSLLFRKTVYLLFLFSCSTLLKKNGATITFRRHFQSDKSHVLIKSWFLVIPILNVDKLPRLVGEWSNCDHIKGKECWSN